jgi:hypothetical protein
MKTAQQKSSTKRRSLCNSMVLSTFRLEQRLGEGHVTTLVWRGLNNRDIAQVLTTSEQW